MHCRYCKALPLHIKFKLGMFTVDVDNTTENQLQDMFSKSFIGPVLNTVTELEQT